MGPQTTKGAITFGGVEFSQDASLFTAKSTKETILSAGPIGTPAILMNSGVGDKNALAALGIPSALDPPQRRPKCDPPMTFASWSTGSVSGTPTGDFICFRDSCTHPTSRGTITLQSNNPFDPPLIDPGLLVTDFDPFTARESIKKTYRFVEASVWKDYIIAPTVDLLNMSTDALDEFIRNTSDSSGHIVLTVAMSAKDASYGAPFVPSAHIRAATYVVAERGANLVKER
ncbi:Choline dehydrogenase [Mycena sanguinolenta]|uniref:Choline dehydrogenase n=1 Tax=Mycena sanguinolenta TaxID=230812 RepID=A0A8H6Z7K9_9AGAR|nr:Choline dehydrogenase [Mycena sanguinolenta]